MSNYQKKPALVVMPFPPGYQPPIALTAFDPTAAVGGDGDDVDDDNNAQAIPAPLPNLQPTAQPHTPPLLSPTGHNYAHLDDDGRTWMHPSTDTKGHSIKLQFRSPAAIGRQIELCLNSKFFPYRSSSDLIRHAVYRHLQWLTTNAKHVPSVMAQVDAMLEVTRDDAMFLEQKTVLSQLQEQCQRHLGLGDGESAKRVISIAVANINTLPPGSWRDSYRARFNQMFQWALQPAEAMKRLSINSGGGVE